MYVIIFVYFFCFNQILLNDYMIMSDFNILMTNLKIILWLTYKHIKLWNVVNQTISNFTFINNI